MGYFLINNEKATDSNNVSRNASSTATLPETTMTSSSTTDNASCKAHNTSMFDDDGTMYVSQPAEMDVLCGQDKTFTHHPGNKLYRSMIASWSERYGQTNNKQVKMQMTTEICKYMKTKYNSRFLKPTSSMMCMEEDIVGSTLEGGSNNAAVAFRFQVLTDQAARDKISHALRTSATVSRKRQERREKMKAIVQQKKTENKHNQQSALSEKQGGDQPHAKLDVDELWMASHQSLHESMQSYASIPETRPDLWYRGSHSSDSNKYESLLPVSSQVSFNSSTDMTSSLLSSQQLLVDDSDAWHAAGSHWDYSQNVVEPLPLSSPVGLTSFSTEVSASSSLSQLLFDNGTDRVDVVQI